MIKTRKSTQGWPLDLAPGSFVLSGIHAWQATSFQLEHVNHVMRLLRPARRSSSHLALVVCDASFSYVLPLLSFPPGFCFPCVSLGIFACRNWLFMVGCSCYIQVLF